MGASGNGCRKIVLLPVAVHFIMLLYLDCLVGCSLFVIFKIVCSLRSPSLYLLCHAFPSTVKDTFAHEFSFGHCRGIVTSKGDFSFLPYFIVRFWCHREKMSIVKTDPKCQLNAKCTRTFIWAKLFLTFKHLSNEKWIKETEKKNGK